MRRYVQVLNNKAHWIFETDETMEQLRQRFAPDILFVDITDQPDVEEGWDYHSDTQTFAQPIIPQPSIDERLSALDKTYQPQFDTLKLAWAAAQLDGNIALVNELQTEYQVLKQEYQTKREAIING